MEDGQKDEQEEVLNSIFFDAYNNSETPEEQLEILAFDAGVSVEQALANLAFNMPEDIVRQVLTGILVQWFRTGMAQQTLNIVALMSRAIAGDGITDGD